MILFTNKTKKQPIAKAVDCLIMSKKQFIFIGILTHNPQSSFVEK